jgi:hypothetical protein
MGEAIGGACLRTMLSFRFVVTAVARAGVRSSRGPKHDESAAVSMRWARFDPNDGSHLALSDVTEDEARGEIEDNRHPVLLREVRGFNGPGWRMFADVANPDWELLERKCERGFMCASARWQRLSRVERGAESM